VEEVAVGGVVAAAGQILGPLDGYVTIVKLVPSNVPLGFEKVLIGFWIMVQLVVYGSVLWSGLRSLPEELDEMQVIVVFCMELR